MKTVFLAPVLLAVTLSSDFDQERARALTTRWFDARGAILMEELSGLGRHFAKRAAQHYLLLSEFGHSKGLEPCDIYPLGPLTIRGFPLLTGSSHLVAEIILATTLSLAACGLFHGIAARRLAAGTASRALIFLVGFSGSIFYQFVCGGALSFLLLMLLWSGLERNPFGLAWIATFLLPLCRAIGMSSVLLICWYWPTHHQFCCLGRWRWLHLEHERLESGLTGSSLKVPRPSYALITAPPFGIGLYFLLIRSGKVMVH